jgi:glycosyltransferase involved in cell wall biosynthesis
MTEQAPPFSVIIPAHNEANVIAGCLRAIYDSAPADAIPEVIVACNGCSDDTAAVARRTAPSATVIELAEGSKPLALNAASAVASAFPRLIVDADIEADYATLATVADILRRPGVMAASPAAEIETQGCDRWVQAYYRVWRHHPYGGRGTGGSGVYGLSREGFERIGSFPPIISDDGFVRASFLLSEQRRISKSESGQRIATIVRAPRAIAELIRSEARRRSGDAQLRSTFGPPSSDEGGPAAGMLALWREGIPLLDLAVYSAIKLAGRVLYQVNRVRGRAGHWHRDESTRQKA